MHTKVFAALALSVCLLTTQARGELPAPLHPLELRDGERVTLLGGTFIERMQTYGYLETLLTAAHPDRNITFRNLGWSGDNVWGHSRAVFGSPDSGVDRLLNDVKLAAPTLIVVCYGENEAREGIAGVERFRAGLTRLIDELTKATGARIVLLGPRKHENLGPPLPNQDSYNGQLDEFLAAIRDVANDRNCPFVDLSDVLPLDEKHPLTFNGIHPSEAGYRTLAAALASKFSPDIKLPVASFDEPRGEKLRQAIFEKNELFFHRHRPQNETYLFLFRKHEQGNNAVEIPQFDPLIEAKEKEIALLRKE